MRGFPGGGGAGFGAAPGGGFVGGPRAGPGGGGAVGVVVRGGFRGGGGACFWRRTPRLPRPSGALGGALGALGGRCWRACGCGGRAFFGAARRDCPGRQGPWVGAARGAGAGRGPRFFRRRSVPLFWRRASRLPRPAGALGGALGALGGRSLRAGGCGGRAFLAPRAAAATVGGGPGWALLAVLGRCRGRAFSAAARCRVFGAARRGCPGRRVPWVGRWGRWAGAACGPAGAGGARFLRRRSVPRFLRGASRPLRPAGALGGALAALGGRYRRACECRERAFLAPRAAVAPAGGGPGWGAGGAGRGLPAGLRVRRARVFCAARRGYPGRRGPWVGRWRRWAVATGGPASAGSARFWRRAPRPPRPAGVLGGAPGALGGGCLRACGCGGRAFSAPRAAAAPAGGCPGWGAGGAGRALPAGLRVPGARAFCAAARCRVFCAARRGRTGRRGPWVGRWRRWAVTTSGPAGAWSARFWRSAPRLPRPAGVLGGAPGALGGGCLRACGCGGRAFLAPRAGAATVGGGPGWALPAGRRVPGARAFCAAARCRVFCSARRGCPGRRVPWVGRWGRWAGAACGPAGAGGARVLRRRSVPRFLRRAPRPLRPAGALGGALGALGALGGGCLRACGCGERAFLAPRAVAALVGRVPGWAVLALLLAALFFGAAWCGCSGVRGAL